MMRAVFADDIGVAVVQAALKPFAWRSFTAPAVCRRAAVAMEAAGAFSGLTAASSEECVEALMEALSGCNWRSFSAEGLSRFLMSSARTWQMERSWFDIRLGLLLDGMG